MKIKYQDEIWEVGSINFLDQTISIAKSLKEARSQEKAGMDYDDWQVIEFGEGEFLVPKEIQMALFEKE